MPTTLDQLQQECTPEPVAETEITDNQIRDEIAKCMDWWIAETGSQPDERTAEDCMGADWEGVRDALGGDAPGLRDRYEALYLREVKWGY